MKLEYRVLCIDDNLPTLATVKKDFIRLNNSVGIKTTFFDVNAGWRVQEEPEELRERIKKEIAQNFKDNDFDLIMVDLHMTGKDGGLDGQDIVKFIRDGQTIYRPIAFYSAGIPAEDDGAKKQLYVKAEEAGILGKSIFITTRKELPKLLTDIAKEMHGHEHQLNKVRGMLMDRVSEIDAEVIKIVSSRAIWEKIPDTDKNKVLKAFKKLIVSQCKKSKRKYLEVKDMSFDGIIDYIISDPRHLGTFEKAKILREIARYLSEISKYGDVFSEFINDDEGVTDLKDMSLNTIRNHYAHNTAEELSVVHDDDLCTYIRKQSHYHAENIAFIKAKI